MDAITGFDPVTQVKAWGGVNSNGVRTGSGATRSLIVGDLLAIRERISTVTPPHRGDSTSITHRVAFQIRSRIRSSNYTTATAT